MIKKIRFLYEAIYSRIISKKTLAKSLGVEFGEHCDFMTRSWGSEPYLIKMGDYVTTSSGVKFVTHDGSMRVLRQVYPECNKMDYIAPIIIGNNVFIGMDSIILPSVTIGDNVIIGAASLVKGELKSNSVYAGVPARYICSIEEYKEKNKYKFLPTKQLSPFQKKEFLLKKFVIEEDK